jgi:flavin reductase (DIM6/NTAB) family NADH-FMN oxidoreductase RutF
MKRYSSHFPDPVALVTVATESRANVMTVGWASPVSFKPPILMVSIAPARFTHGLVLEAGEFGVSILADDQKDLSTAAGTASGATVDKLAAGRFATIEPEIIRAPLIAGARAWYECTLLSHHRIGDHTAFYGEVVRSAADETKKPLVLFNRKYYSLGLEIGAYP